MHSNEGKSARKPRRGEGKSARKPRRVARRVSPLVMSIGQFSQRRHCGSYRRSFVRCRLFHHLLPCSVDVVFQRGRVTAPQKQEVVVRKCEGVELTLTARVVLLHPHLHRMCHLHPSLKRKRKAGFLM